MIRRLDRATGSSFVCLRRAAHEGPVNIAAGLKRMTRRSPGHKSGRHGPVEWNSVKRLSDLWL